MLMTTELHPIVASALGSTRLEGGELDDATITLVDRVVRGDLTGDEAVAIVRRDTTGGGRQVTATP